MFHVEQLQLLQNGYNITIQLQILDFLVFSCYNEIKNAKNRRGGGYSPA